ncbi:hypothetical protein H2200_010171 [Cladophialophora chaetospira]|uniref:Uncharacterized protein n=1 Tax=Cladophialophora chaetospira TaxID=386627 RepID=A0AA38X2D7_9EURO|nr:hypothetical protein H2200_010171 [Cladophialophora chaetospira]
MSSHLQIAHALTRIYNFFVKVGYITEDQMRWPPHSTEDLDLELCRDAGFSEEAISLLSQIPWATVSLQFQPDCMLVDYSKAELMKASRHPDSTGSDHSATNPLLQDTMVTIAIPMNQGARSYILDARTGNLLIGWAVEMNDLEPNDAVEFLDDMYNKLTSLNLIPVGDEIFDGEDVDAGLQEGENSIYAKAKTALLEYGWPDTFRTEDFRRDIWDLREEWDNELGEEYAEQMMTEHMAGRLGNTHIGAEGPAEDPARSSEERTEH